MPNETYPVGDPRKNQNDTYTQLVISVALGLTAFVSFCVARPRWAGLYAGRKKHDSKLPELPDTFLGWIPVLYRITQDEVLASAGLDAYVLLSFCRMAIKFIAIAFLFGLVIIYPVHNSYLPPEHHGNGYLWMYVVFVYVFSGLLVYLISRHTRDIIKVRQDYLGSQSTVTDRTIKLSGIPFELQSEDKIKSFVEGLEIGKVEHVTLCRNWKELDSLMDRRTSCLRKLEEAWTVHLGHQRESLPIVQPSPPGPGVSERSHLLSENSVPYGRDRPTIRIRYGLLRTKKVDAIDYYEEKLRKLDEQVKATRKKTFAPTPLAFVTMDSVATCQMAVQAILDSSPLVLLANPAPAPPDIIWPNTYLTRTNRMLRSWLITIFVIVLTIFWALLLGPVAGLTKLETIEKFFPALGRLLSHDKVIRSLVQTSLPTLAWSLLNLAVPYLYDWLSNLQGILAQGDVELAVISKNFAFTFFNLFILYTVIGVALNLTVLRKSLEDTRHIAFQLAKNLDGLANFYMNLIMLQGIGLFPFRLLDFGSVALYPVTLIGAKTPRDYAELVQPSTFRYGFYLPQTILIFIVCIVYSMLPVGVILLFFGLVYFVIGFFTYKYQLLYAMEHPRHSTGQMWSIIVNRVLLGLLVFQLAMIGELAIKQAAKRSLLLVPLLPVTVWCGYFYRKSYAPLTRFIALNSINRRSAAASHDEQEAKDMKYVNPNLITP